MEQTSVRETIFTKLKKSPKTGLQSKKGYPDLPELHMTKEELVAAFSQNVALQTGIVYRLEKNEDLTEKIQSVLEEENVKELAVSDDVFSDQEDLKRLQEDTGISVVKISDFPNREACKDYLFTRADAGVTGADFAVAESGTIVIAHNRKNSRLISLAPVLHIALVKIENLVPVYEAAVKEIFRAGLPSQVTFITGPSMTADIQATPFKGMHGPKKLIILLAD